MVCQGTLVCTLARGRPVYRRMLDGIRCGGGGPMRTMGTVSCERAKGVISKLLGSVSFLCAGSALGLYYSGLSDSEKNKSICPSILPVVHAEQSAGPVIENVAVKSERKTDVIICNPPPIVVVETGEGEKGEETIKYRVFNVEKEEEGGEDKSAFNEILNRYEENAEAIRRYMQQHDQMNDSNVKSSKPCVQANVMLSQVILDNRQWFVSYFVKQRDQYMIEYMRKGDTAENWSEVVASIMHSWRFEPNGKPKKTSLKDHMKSMFDIAKTYNKVSYWKVVHESDKELVFEYAINNESEYYLFRLVSGNQAMYVFNYASKRGGPSNSNNQQQKLGAAIAHKDRLRWIQILRAIPVFENGTQVPF
eukprot:Nk52_evm43s78 gene=Nk52_evmTU43s78